MGEWLVEWAKCQRCGKEVQWSQTRTEDESEFRLRVQVARMGLCTGCEADLSREFDSCPETLWHQDADGAGVSGCCLSYRHGGRCEPYEIEIPPVSLEEGSKE